MRYSYSGMATWQKCPRQFEAKYITRTWPETPPTPALVRGKAVHNALEQYLIDGTPVDAALNVWTPDGLLDKLRQAQATPEVKLEWSRPHVIGYVDVLLTVDDAAVVIDWKTGKLRPDPLQSDVYTALLRWNGVAQDISFTWVGVDSCKTVSSQPDRNAERRVLDLIDMIEADQTYPPIKSWLCRFCPLTWCEHHDG
ncbi:MAG: PD-(D/E)XK nuclease family protein [Rhodospirillales bacterium]|nr:MAG: PD-(D/E)XK nuclease family protein [Rhodospirillales bacterium]